MTYLFMLGLVLAVFWLFAIIYLQGTRLARFDAPRLNSTVGAGGSPSAAHGAVLERIAGLFAQGNESRGAGAKLAGLRAAIDSVGADASLADITLQPVTVGGMKAEWVLAEGSDPDRRLLYLHGGAWMMGSPLSHRCITTALARRTGCAVLAIDYRLMPEHGRLACAEDCLAAYRWILENGPAGPAPVRSLFVAGDSAGGNLTLVTIAAARDTGLRRADAAVALSPATDGTLTGPSLRTNLATDHMLAPMFGGLTKVPHVLLLWAMWLKARLRPCDPRVSPVHGDLAGLPPTLVHVSEAEMLLDDARRYVNKANASGSRAVLESWPHMVHVWHFFEPTLPEAKHAFDRITAFLDSVAPRTTAS